MINLDFKKIDGFSKAFNLINDSSKSRMVLDPICAQETTLRKRVAEYLLKRRCLERLKENKGLFDPCISMQLKDCYNNMPSGLSAYIDKVHRTLLKKVQAGPYCLISEADSKDHYLPKEKFPEFSFFVFNLVPCCTNCNRRKGEKWLDQGERAFFNPYFDLLPKRFLGVDVSATDMTVSFYLVERKGVIFSHVNKLKIIERYNDQGSAVLSSVLGLVEEYAELQDDQTFRNYMDREYRRHSSRFGENHYTSLIYESLRDNGVVISPKNYSR